MLPVGCLSCVIAGPTSLLAMQGATSVMDFEDHPSLGKQKLLFQLQKYSESREIRDGDGP